MKARHYKGSSGISVNCKDLYPNADRLSRAAKTGFQRNIWCAIKPLLPGTSGFVLTR